MKFLRKLFSKKHNEEDSQSSPEPVRAVLQVEEGDPFVPIDPHSITLAFIALTHKELDRVDVVKHQVLKLNKALQPRLWNVEFDTKYTTFTVDENDAGVPDVNDILIALKHNGVMPTSSILFNDASISLDGNISRTDVFVGFVFDEEKPRIIVSSEDTCVSK